MEKDYTQEQLVQFIYRETTITDHFEIENAIEEDSGLRKVYNYLYQAYLELPKVQFIPSKRVVNNILDYSKLAA